MGHRSLALAVAVGLVCLVAGWWLGLMLIPTARGETAGALTVESSLPPVPQRTDVALTALADGQRERLQSEGELAGQGSLGDELLITEALREHARQGLRRGWASQRPDTMAKDDLVQQLQLFEDRVLSLPESMGVRLAREQTEQERLASRTDIEVLLAELDDGGGPLLDLVGDPEAFGRFFEPMHSGPVRSGPSAGPQVADDLADGTTLLFPPGVFRVDLRKLHNGRFPSDLTLAGSGMGVTLLIVGDVASHSRPMERFAIRDCTVFTDNDSLIDQRSRVATLMFDRVHFLGFDRGSGSSAWLEAAETALIVRDCVIEGGYGRSVGSGYLLDIRTDGLLARFERCTLERLRLNPSSIRSGATVVFQSCRLTDMLDSPGAIGTGKKGLVLPGTTVTYWQAGELPQLDLNDLFPDWKKSL